MDTSETAVRTRRRRVVEWLRRYAPAEVAATAGAVLAAWIASTVLRAAGANEVTAYAASAYAATVGESIFFYGVLLVRDLRAWPPPRRGRAAFGVLRGLVLEFGMAEVVDTLLIRPLAMYLCAMLIGDVTTGVIAGKVAADAVFYTLAVVGYEARRSLASRRSVGEPVGEPLDARHVG